MLGVILPMLIYAARAVQIIADPEISFDTLHTYLPLARAFLENPGDYFNLPRSVMVAPGAVLYMALWGADPVAIKSANLFLGLLSLVLASDAARRIAGPPAGAAAAWAFALSQTLVSSGVTLLGEAPFVSLVMVWLWACAYATQDADQPEARRNTAVAVAGVCLAAATLTRATWLYWLPVAILGGLLAALMTRGPTRVTCLRLTLVHVIAFILVGAFVARQWEHFDRPLVATGSGGALYFGSNPMLHGYEPPFFGLAHDEVMVTDGLGHLSLEGDRRLSAVTRVALLNTPAKTLATMYFQKLGAFLFFSRVHLGRHLLNERALRVALFVMTLVGAALGRKRPMVWLLASAIGYQCAVHIPVMYNPRYSASALDPLLTLLAASGVGFLMLQAAKIRRRLLGVAGLVILLGIAFGVWHQRHSAPLMPEISAGPHRLLQAALPAEITVEGSVGNPFEAPARLPNGKLHVVWHPSSLELSGLSVLNISVPHLEGSCSQLLLTYTEPTGLSRSDRLQLNGWKAPQSIAWGTSAINLPNHTGSLHLRFDCDPDTVIGFGRMGLFDVSIGRYYRKQALDNALAPPISTDRR